jgi:hypothetical protein
MDNNKCILIGNVFANTMQFVVCIISIAVLFFHKIFIENDVLDLKRKLFKNHRPNIDKRIWSIWLMDNSKQGASSAIAHIYATYIARVFSIGNEEDDECGWFLIQFIVDTIFGLLFSFIISKITLHFCKSIFPQFYHNWLIIGNYNTNGVKNKYYVWILQVFHWIWCSMIARILCTLIILISLRFWTKLNIQFSDQWINNRHNELVFVILGMPILLNSIQFLVTNTFLHWKRPILNQYIRQPLLNS